ncbi:hypothetical protein AAFF_G00202240 [Aldrovandia affinis]|uniref:Uncharacterized protein n=1 Tax=Aldrovandia affinis TaxID=143900 RepID=A0AAD7SX14_9TELE|nr:hypothetical protein AAFF_G00202240 [Aldrovandia affinis]
MHQKQVDKHLFTAPQGTSQKACTGGGQAKFHRCPQRVLKHIPSQDRPRPVVCNLTHRPSATQGRNPANPSLAGAHLIGRGRSPSDWFGGIRASGPEVLKAHLHGLGSEGDGRGENPSSGGCSHMGLWAPPGRQEGGLNPSAAGFAQQCDTATRTSHSYL